MFSGKRENGSVVCGRCQAETFPASNNSRALRANDVRRYVLNFGRAFSEWWTLHRYYLKNGGNLPKDCPQWRLVSEICQKAKAPRPAPANL
jgi:hypothetical protein